MKTLITAAALILSASAFARDIDLKVDLSQHLSHIASVKVFLTYESQSSALGCQTYSGDILEPLRPIYIEKSLVLENGVVRKNIATELDRCNAKLVSVDMNLRMDRKAVARTYNASKNDVDKNRIDFHFHVSEYAANQPIYTPKLKISRLYVAGSDDLKYTFSTQEIAQVIDDSIDLSL